MNAAPPRVEVLILNFNGRHLLDPCLWAMERQRYRDFRVTVIDNGSHDGSVGWLKERWSGVAVVEIGQNLGFAGAYDRAIRASPSEVVALLNNDAEPDPGWLGALVAALDAHPEVAAVTSRIRFAADPRVLNHAGGSLSPIGSGFDIGFGEPDGPAFGSERYCGSPSGAACAVRRADFVDAGGFDPRYFAWFEDTDLGWRLWLRGRRVLYVPEAGVSHRYGGTGGGRVSALRVYHCQKNRLANATKNLGARRLILALAVGAAYDLVRTARLVARRKTWPAALAIWRGNLAFLVWAPRLLRDRRRVQAARELDDGDLRQAGALATWRETWRAFRLAESYRKAAN